MKLHKPHWATAAKVGVRSKFENVKFSEQPTAQGFWINLSGGRVWGRLPFPKSGGDSDWTYRQELVTFKPNCGDELTLDFGLRGGAIGKCLVDDARVEFIK